MSSRLRRLGNGVGWGGVSTVAVAGFQLAFMALLARLLEPAYFGLVAMANVSLRFLSYFSQMGIQPALVQKAELTAEDQAAALALSLGIATVFTALTVVLAPLVAQFFDMPDLEAVLRVMALSFLFTGVSAVSVGVLRRAMRFQRLALIDTLSYVLGYGVVGLGLAWTGYGVWALVGAALTQAGCTAVLAWQASRYPLRLAHGTVARRHFLSFGGRYSIAGFLEFLTSNLDAIFVGKQFGEAAAGLYNRALLLANLPVQQPANVLTRALFPVLSTLNDARDKQVSGFQLGVLVVGGYAFAVGAGLSAAAPDIVRVVLGEQWLGAIPVLAILAWSVGPLFVSHMAGVTLDARAVLGPKIRIQAATLLVLIAGLVLALPHGIEAMALAVVIAEWLRMVAYWVVMRRVLEIPARESSIVVLALVLLAVTAGGAVWGAASGLPAAWPAFGRLMLEVLAGAAGLLLGFAVSRVWLPRLAAVRWLIGRVPRLARLFPKAGA